MEPITFAHHKEVTATDLETIAQAIKDVAAQVREGNMAAFEKFWIEGGTEEGDAKIRMIRDTVVLRYLVRQENVDDALSKEERNPNG